MLCIIILSVFSADLFCIFFIIEKMSNEKPTSKQLSSAGHSSAGPKRQVSSETPDAATPLTAEDTSVVESGMGLELDTELGECASARDVQTPLTPIDPNYEYHHTDNEENVAYFVALNAIIQLIGDIVLEGLHLIPTRINHLSLTILNAFISAKTLKAIHQDDFKFLRADCQVFCLLETLLIFGDVYYAALDKWDVRFIFIRMFFIACSVFNLAFTFYVIQKYRFY